MIKNLVSVVFPTLNRKESLINCIKSIKNNTYKKVEIIVGDNGSTDGSRKEIKKMFPDVILLENELNLGSPMAINKCIGKSKGEFIFRLDDDVILEKDTIKEMLKKLKSDDKIGAVSCLCFYSKKPKILETTGMKINLFTGKTKIYNANEEYCGVFEEYNGQFNRWEVVREAVGGGTTLTRRKIFDEVGLYDENYYLSYEDVDWCYRLRKEGYKIVVISSTRLYHKAMGGDVKNTSFRIYLNERARVLFMKKFAGWRNLIVFPYLFFVICPVKTILFLM